MIERCFAILATAIFLTSFGGQAADVAGLLHPSKKMTCTPQRLTEASAFTVNLPGQHGDSLIVLLPDTDYSRVRYVVYPQPRWPLKLTAQKFKTMKSVTWKVQDFVGTASFPNYVFVASGRYTVVVGSGFDTPSPIVDGWCALDYNEPVPYRDRSLPRPGPLREGQAWNKMKCSPAVVTPDSTLTIALPFPHGNYLEISRRVDARPLHVVAPAQTATIAADDFTRMRSLSLRVPEIQGTGGRGAEPVFVKSGVYTIRVGGHFEIDSPAAIDGWCRVRFKGARRR